MQTNDLDPLLERLAITPVPTFNSDIHPLHRRQCHWVSRDGIETASFAGKEMMILEDDAGYRLTYLDMAHPTLFSSAEQAKTAAPRFAQAVLLTMAKLIDQPVPAHAGA